MTRSRHRVFKRRMRKDQPVETEATPAEPSRAPAAPAGRLQEERAAALRANLLRRKQQTRARAAATPKDGNDPCR